MRRVSVSLICGLVCLSALVTAAPGDWAYWRGPNADGMAVGDAPLKWSDKQGIKWKAPVPGKGFSSPVIWDDRVFLTTAVPVSSGERLVPTLDGLQRAATSQPLAEHRFVVLCYNRKTGALLWEKVARVDTPHETHHPQYGSFASNSPATDGRHVYAFFGSRGLYAYTLDGELVWKKEDFPKLRMHMAFGEGAWTWLEGNTLLVVVDHRGDSYMVALDKLTGNERWRVPRLGATNWSGPYVTTANGRKQVVVSASQEVVGYDFETGKRIWWARGLGQNTIPQPVAYNGLVFAMSGFVNPNLMAIKLGREGDLTDTDAVVWQNQRGNSYTPSPVLHDGILYLLTDSGMLSALDAKTGTPHYQQQRLPKPYQFKASPVGAGGKLYLATEADDVVVVKMGKTFEVLATNTLAGHTFIASPAIANGELYLRSQSTLFAIR